MKYLDDLICVEPDGSTQSVPVTFFENSPALPSNEGLPRVDVYDKKQILIFADKEEHINQISEQIIYRGCPCSTISKRKIGPIIEFEIFL